jgi:nucleoside-diphosphate-sugar epimerase
MKKRVIITGPTGAVGMALIQKCIAEKTEVLALCHKGSKRIADIPENLFVTVKEADLSEFHKLQPAENEKYDAMFHFGWMGTTGAARNDMELQCRNIEYTIDAVRLAQRFGCKFFIGAGSQAEYGRTESNLTSQTPVFPENGYGMAKLCAGEMSRELCHQLGIKHIWVRILSVYGPYDGPNTMISSAIRTMLEGKKMKFTAGEQKWDYLYSKDAAEALWRLWKKGTDGKVYVLGSGSIKTLKEYIQEIYCAVLEINPNAGRPCFGEIPYIDGQVMYLGADIRELTEDTGFMPEVSFADGIREVIAGIRVEG